MSAAVLAKPLRQRAAAGVAPEERPVESHGERKRRSNRMVWKIVGGWLVVLVAIVLIVRQFSGGAPERVETDRVNNFAGTDADESMAFLEDALPKCQQALTGFLQSSAPEERNQFVFSPIRTASRMARFYALNPVAKVDPGTLRFGGSGVLRLPEENAIETRWTDDQGREIEVVFRKEQDEWRIDWPHFVRESDYPWPLFLAGDGESEGEFRLLARERLAEERKPGDPISLVLHAPRFGDPKDEGPGSPEILVPSTSREGRLIDAAFRARRDGVMVYGLNLKSQDPGGMIRLRVRVQRASKESGHGFQITEVIACHWLSVDDPGIDPDAVLRAPDQKESDRSRIDED